MTQKLNKVSIASYLNNVSGLPKSLCRVFVSNYFNGILELTFANKEFLMRYFGKFFLVQTKFRNIRGFVESEKFVLQPKEIVKFKSSDKLRDFFNRN